MKIFVSLANLNDRTDSEIILATIPQKGKGEAAPCRSHVTDYVALQRVRRTSCRADNHMLATVQHSTARMRQFAQFPYLNPADLDALGLELTSDRRKCRCQRSIMRSHRNQSKK